MLRFWTRICPSSGCSEPKISLSKEVLPAPLGACQENAFAFFDTKGDVRIAPGSLHSILSREIIESYDVCEMAVMGIHLRVWLQALHSSRASSLSDQIWRQKTRSPLARLYKEGNPQSRSINLPLPDGAGNLKGLFNVS